jgi:hypothetical protein
MQDESSPVERAMAMNGKVTAQDLEQELEQMCSDIAGEPRVKGCGIANRAPTAKEGRANLLVEVQTEDAWLFLSFNDRSARRSLTVRIDATNVAALISMLSLADVKQVDSKCYVDGEVQVSRA